MDKFSGPIIPLIAAFVISDEKEALWWTQGNT